MFTGYYVLGMGVWKLVAVLPVKGSSSLTDMLVMGVEARLEDEVGKSHWFKKTNETCCFVSEALIRSFPLSEESSRGEWL